MKKKFRNLIMLFAAVLLLSTAANAATEVASGYCGDEGEGTNLTWTLYSDGLLIISGEGKMKDYLSYSEVPWYSCRNQVESVAIGPGVANIGGHAFHYCQNLTNVDIPNRVTSIGYHAFANCIALEHVAIPSSVTTIGDYAFLYCKALANVTIPNGVTSIGPYAFCSCTSLTSIAIPDSMTTIYWNAFESCTALERVTLGSGLTSISNKAFKGCTALTSVTIPDSVTIVAWNAFESCTALKNVTLSSSLTSIDDCVFSGCTALERITIPNSVTLIGERSFDGCTDLEKVFYGGSAADWNRLEISSGNECLASAQIICNAASVIGGISVYTLAGEAQQTIPTGQCLVTVPIENVQQTDSVTVFLVSYTENGQYQGMGWMTFRNLPVGVTVEVTLPLDNSTGKIATLRAFVVESIFSPIPLGAVATFGTF